MHSHMSLKFVIMHSLEEFKRRRNKSFIKQKQIEQAKCIMDSFDTIDGEHDPTLTNTNVEWMQENMNPVDYEPRKSKKTKKENEENLEKFTE